MAETVPTHHAPRPARILVVDDEPNIRSSICEALTLVGYEATEAPSGLRALELVRAGHYDLMILDMRMPGMDGVEVMTQVRGIHPRLPILILTGHATLDSAIAAVKAHAVDYVLKPASLHEITRAVAAALSARQAQVHLQSLLSEAAKALDALEPLPEDSTLPPAREVERRAPARVPEPARVSEARVHAGPLTLDARKRCVTVEEKPVREVELTGGEALVLAYLMAHPNQPITCSEIAQEVWGYALEEIQAISLVRPYIFRLRQKLEPNPRRPRWICTLRGSGYLLKLD